MTAAQRTLQEAALAYAAIGWPVFPKAPGGKQPAISRASTHRKWADRGRYCPGGCGLDGHGHRDATTDPDKIAYWWRRDPDRNIGIATGAPGPDVVDVDTGEGYDGMPAFRQARRSGVLPEPGAIIRTPSTGIHAYYAGTGQPCGTIRGRHVEYNAAGGSVTAPPSGAAGGGYVVVSHQPLITATVDWEAVRDVLDPGARARARAAQRRRNGPGRGGGEGRLDRLAGVVDAGVAGDRNYRLFWAAREAGRAGLLDAAAADRLVQASVDSGLSGGEREARRTIASAQRHAAREAASPGPFAGAPQRQMEAG
jgi:Bifunctional DNA primase/polymerase, N-terminal